MKQICEGVVATYDGQKVIRGQLVIYMDHCVFTGGGLSREFRWDDLEKLNAQRIEVTVPNSMGMRKQPALRLSCGDAAQLWMMTADVADGMVRSIDMEKEIGRRVEQRLREETDSLREELERQKAELTQANALRQCLEEQMRLQEGQLTQERERMRQLLTELEAAQKRIAELTEPVAAETPAFVSVAEEAPAFVPVAEEVPAFVPAEEPAPAQEPEPAAEEVSPAQLMEMLHSDALEEPAESLLVTTLQTKLAGASDYNADGSNRQRIIRELCRRNRLRGEQELLLVRDCGQMGVVVPGDPPEQIGCLSAEDVEMVARAVDCRVFVEEVTGGAGGGFYGVTLRLQLYMSVRDAEHALPRLEAGEEGAAEIPAEPPQPAVEAWQQPVSAAEEAPRPRPSDYASRDDWSSAGKAADYGRARQAWDSAGEKSFADNGSAGAPWGSGKKSDADSFGGNKDKWKNF